MNEVLFYYVLFYYSVLISIMSKQTSLFAIPLSIDVEDHSSSSEFIARNPQSHNPNVFEFIKVGKPGERPIIGPLRDHFRFLKLVARHVTIL